MASEINNESINEEYFFDYYNDIDKIIDIVGEDESLVYDFKYEKDSKIKNKIYVDLCTLALNKTGFALEYIDFEKLPSKTRSQIYLNFCQIAVNNNEFSLRDIIFENLPQENRANIYADLCKKAINNNGSNINVIIFENLPQENRANIYADLCKCAVNESRYCLADVNYDYLPDKNRANIYVDICKVALRENKDGDDSPPHSPLKYVHYDWLPLENRFEIYIDLCKEAIKQSGLFYLDRHINYDVFPIENRDKIYLNLCKLAVSERGYSLGDINYDWLPQENRNQIYLYLCKEAINKDGSSIGYVELEKLPQENRNQIYFELCKHAINLGNHYCTPIAHIKYEWLPQENIDKNYAELCNCFLDKDTDNFLKNIRFVKLDKLTPEYKEQICLHYFNKCKYFFSNYYNNKYLKDINDNYLPIKNRDKLYFKLCKNAIDKGNTEILKFIDYEKLPTENRGQFYLDLYEKAPIIEYLNYDWLPIENRAETYKNLCFLSIKQRGKNLKFVDISKFPLKDKEDDEFHIYLYGCGLRSGYREEDHLELKDVPDKFRFKVTLNYLLESKYSAYSFIHMQKYITYEYFSKDEIIEIYKLYIYLLGSIFRSLNFNDEECLQKISDSGHININNIEWLKNNTTTQEFKDIIYGNFNNPDLFNYYKEKLPEEFHEKSIIKRILEKLKSLF